MRPGTDPDLPEFRVRPRIRIVFGENAAMPLKRQTVRAARRRDEAVAGRAVEAARPPAPPKPRRDPSWHLRVVPGAGQTGPLEHWFEENGWKAFEFQREVWNAYLEGASGLVHSATGSGKTLAAALGPMAEWMAENPT